MKNERLITDKSLFKALTRHCLQAFVMLSIFNFLQGCIPEKEKSEVVITWKKYCPYESGDGITSENEKYLLYIEHTNKRLFKSPILGYTFKTMIIQTNRDSYNKLKIGDKLENKY